MRVRRLLVAASVAMLTAGVVAALLPLHAQGVSGNAVFPHYGDFGFYSYRPLTGRVTTAQFRAAGIHIPVDDVDSRRRLAGALVAAGLIVAVATVTAGRRGATAERAG